MSRCSHGRVLSWGVLSCQWGQLDGVLSCQGVELTWNQKCPAKPSVENQYGLRTLKGKEVRVFPLKMEIKSKGV